MRNLLLAAALALGLGACTPAIEPGPNPACAKAAGGIQTAGHALSIARTALSVAETFGLIKVGSTIELAIATGLDSASAGIDKAKADVALGKCDVSSYIAAAVAAIEKAVTEIAGAKTQAPRALALGAKPPNAGDIDALANEARTLGREALEEVK